MSLKESDINPCRGCLLKYGALDINAVNECCYNVCSSFTQNLNSNTDITETPCGKKCKDAIYNMILVREKNPCEYWPEVPTIKLRQHYFVPCLNSNKGDVQKALQCCRFQCAQDDPRTEAECCYWCDMDAAAVSQDKIKTVENYTNDDSTNQQKTVWYWIGLIFALLLGAIVIVNFIKVLTSGSY